MSMVPTITAYALLALFFALEGALRRGRAARSLAAGSSDRGSTLAVGLAFLLAAAALLLAPLLNYWEVGIIGGSWLVPWLGIFLMLGGVALRAWSNQVLGGLYTRTLRTVEGQRLVREGDVPAGPLASPSSSSACCGWWSIRRRWRRGCRRSLASRRGCGGSWDSTPRALPSCGLCPNSPGTAPWP